MYKCEVKFHYATQVADQVTDLRVAGRSKASCKPVCDQVCDLDSVMEFDLKKQVSRVRIFTRLDVSQSASTQL